MIALVAAVSIVVGVLLCTEFQHKKRRRLGIKKVYHADTGRFYYTNEE